MKTMKLNILHRILLSASFLLLLEMKSQAQSCTTYTAPGVSRCGSGSVTLSVTNGPPPSEDVTYQWKVGGSPISGATDPDYTVTISSTTTYTVTVDDVNCTSPQDITVVATVHALPSAPTMNDGSKCGTGDVTMSVQSPSSGTYQWYFNSAGTNAVPTNDDDYTFSGTGNSTMTANLSTTTSFWVKHTTTNGCVSSLSQVDGTIHSYPTVDAGSNISVCQNSGTYNLTNGSPNPSSGGTWSSTNSTVNSAINSGAQTVNINAISPGTYTIDYSYTNAGGCTSNDSRQLTVKATTANPTVNSSQTTVDICDGETIELLIDGQPSQSDPVNGYSFEWFYNIGDQTPFSTATSITVSPSADITYYLSATDANGCPSARQAITVDVNALPADPVIANVDRCGTGDVTMQVTSPTTGTTVWYFDSQGTNPVPTSGGGYIYSGSGNSTLTVTGLSTTTNYWVKNVGTNGCESDNLTAVTATINPLPTVNAGSDFSVCENAGTVRLDTLGASPSSGGVWSSTNSTANSAISAQTININLLPVGPYTIDFDYTDGNGCPNSDSRTITVKATTALPKVNSNKTTVTACPSESVELLIDGQTSGQDPTGGYSFEWFHESTDTSPFSTATSITVSHTADEDYYLQATDGTGCPSGLQLITFDVLPAPADPQFVDATIEKCNTEDVRVEVTSPTTGTNEWFFDSQGLSPVTEGGGYTFSGTGNSILDIVGLGTDLDLWVQNVGTNGCESSNLKKVEITIHPLPAAPTVPTVSETCGSTDVIRANPPTGVTWYWQTATDGESTTNSAGTYTMTSSGTAYLRGRNNASLCWGPTTSLAVTVEQNNPPAGLTAGNNVLVFVNSGFDLNNTGESPAGGTWSGTHVTGGNTFNSSVTGTFTVTYTYNDGGHCDYTATKSVEVRATPVMTTSGTTVLHRGTTVDLIVPDVAEYSYQWYKDGTALAGETGLTITASEIGDYHAVATTTDNASTSTSITFVDEPLFSQNKSFVRTQTMRIETTEMTPFRKERVTESYSYVDGLGRAAQSVQSNASPSGKDLVVPAEYDTYGRQAKDFLPYESTELYYGVFQADALIPNDYANSDHRDYYENTSSHQSTRAFTERSFETSPMNRLASEAAPGSAWQNKPVEYDYNFNETSDSVIDFDWDDLLTQSKVTFAANELTKNEVADEDDNETIEFTNKLGQTLLKKSLVSGTTWAETHYIYDHFGRLRVVIPPEASSLLDADFYATGKDRQAFLDLWAFQYTYDGRGRMTEKKVPGAEKVLMIYDRWDRLVLTQDGNQRDSDQWLFTKYDDFDRPVSTGLLTVASSTTEASVRAAVLASTERGESYSGTGETLYSDDTYPTDTVGLGSDYLTITYYDDYLFEGVWTEDLAYDETKAEKTVANIVTGATLLESNYSMASADDTKKFVYEPDVAVTIPVGVTLTPGSEVIPYVETVEVDHEKNDYVKGQVTGSAVKTGDGNWIKGATYYDQKYRVIQTQSTNHLSGYIGKDVVTNYYDFIGQVTKTVNTHSDGQNSTSITRRFEYDHAGRLLETYHQVDNEAEVLLASNSYNELGELTEKDLHSGKQSLDYTYNIRGWLTAINDSDLSTSLDGDLFGMNLLYDQTDAEANNSALFNGNISAVKWSTPRDHESTDLSERAYKFSYDGLNRLTSAESRKNSSGWSNTSYYEGDYSYDLNGNITSLDRWPDSGSAMDSLSYSYDGNQLLYVEDDADSLGFYNGHIGSQNDPDYLYDANGNMVKDLNKSIDSIHYNHLNLPVLVVFENAGDSITYLYDAAGIKLQQVVYEGGDTLKITDYVGEFIYETDTSGNRTLQLIQHEEGRVVIKSPFEGGQGDVYDYQYHLKDHLGNTRLTFSTETESYTMVETFETGEDNGFEDLHRHTNSNANTTTGGDEVERLQSDETGAMLFLSVNKGDTVDLSVKANYESAPSGNTFLSTGYNALFTAFDNVYGGAEGVSSTSTDFNDALSGTDMSGKSGTSTAPRAFLNYILFDRNMNYVSAGFQQISTAALGVSAHETISIDDRIADRDGYLLAYLSNENTEAVNVHFDDFTVYHGKTNVVQADDYYPFGLTFNSYSRTAAISNNFKYNSFEHMTDLNLNLYDYQARYYDPAIGRFIQVDPAADLMRRHSPYNYAFDNPMRFIDPDGMMPTDVINNDGSGESGGDHTDTAVTNGANGQDGSGTESDQDGGQKPKNPNEWKWTTNSIGSNSKVFIRLFGDWSRGKDSKNGESNSRSRKRGGFVIAGDRVPGSTQDVEGSPTDEFEAPRLPSLQYSNRGLLGMLSAFVTFSVSSSDVENRKEKIKSEKRTYAEHITVYSRDNKPDSTTKDLANPRLPNSVRFTFKIEGDSLWTPRQ